MNLLALISAILAILIYIPQIIQVWRGKMVFNAATFLLWGFLDAIAAASIFAHGGLHSNWTLPAIYATCVTVLLIGMLKARSLKWGRLETFTAVLVAISIASWMVAGPIMGTIISTSSMLIAGVPQIWDTWQKPKESTVWVWAAYFVVNTMSTVAGKDWSISERFYPACCALFTGIIVLLALRKFSSRYALA